MLRQHKLVRNWTWLWRRATWRSRVLPQFIIVGVQKGGTSSLFRYLAQHPQLLPSFRKEVHYFDGGADPFVNTYAKGMAWYLAHFSHRKHHREGKYCFEASPIYIFNPEAPRRIWKAMPEVKIIVLLRNPTERAISHYFHEKNRGYEVLSIGEAMACETDRLRQALDTANYKDANFIHYSYKQRGLYSRQLSRYLQYFSREQILVLNSEEFYAAPEMIVRQVFEFVGVNTEFRVPDLKARNVSTNRTAVDSGIYEELAEFFRPHNQELYDLLGTRYAWENG